MPLIKNNNPKRNISQEIIIDYKTESLTNNTGVYIFGSKSLDIINKWIVLLKYFQKNN